MPFGVESLGGSLSPIAPAAVSWGPGRLDVLGVDPDGALLHWWHEKKWSGPERLDLGLSTTTALNAVCWGPGRIDLFGADEKKQLCHWWWPGKNLTWGGRETLPNLSRDGLTVTPQISTVAATSWAAKRLDVFSAVGNATDPLRHHWWPDRNGGWGLEDLGGPISGRNVQVCATSWGRDRLDVFAVERDRYRVRHWWHEPGKGWGNNGSPEFLPGHGGRSAPAAVSWGSVRLDVFAVGDDNALSHWWYSGGSVWGGPEPLSGSDVWHPPVAVSWASGRLDVFAARRTGQGRAKAVHWWFPENGRWGGSEVLPGEIQVGVEGTPALSATSWAANRLDVFGVAPDSTLRHWWFPA